jgi:protein-tyrosine phosphatase
MIKILFVCLGNICRSPLAQGILQHLVHEKQLDGEIEVDSCGLLDYHTGSNPHERSVQVAENNGVTLFHKARQLSPSDFFDFDYILAMDKSNLKGIYNLKPENAHPEIELIRHWDPKGPDEEVPDPYYGDFSGYELAYSLLERSCREFLDELIRKKETAL